MCDGPDLFLCILAILFPPIAVWVKRGLCGADSLINIALCILGYLPGLIHAWYIVSKNPDVGYETIDSEESRVQVYYVSGRPPPPSAGPTAGAHGTASAGYGSIASRAINNKQSTKPNGSHSGSSRQAQTRSKQQEQALASGPGNEDNAGPSNVAPPPSYSEVVKGDHKIQSHE